MAKHINAPAPRRKWVKGALVRDEITNELYRVTSAPIHYHEDCLAIQKVAKVRDVPPEWKATMRVLEIMQLVGKTGSHTKDSRGAADRTAERPVVEGERVSWEARTRADSYASYPRLEVQADVLTVVTPIYDDSPTVIWLRDATLADEARALIAAKPSITQYPAVSVRGAS